MRDGGQRSQIQIQVGQLRRDMADNERETKETEADYILELKKRTTELCKAMDQIHKQKVDKVKCELCSLSQTLSSTRKVTNEVSKLSLPFITSFTFHISLMLLCYISTRVTDYR